MPKLGRPTRPCAKKLLKLVFQRAKKGVIYQFAYKYADENREILSKFRKAGEIDDYLEDRNILNLLVSYASGKGIPRDEAALKKSGTVIKTQVKAYIARNIIGEEGFYPIIKKIDNTLLKAIEVSKQNLLVESLK